MGEPGPRYDVSAMLIRALAAFGALVAATTVEAQTTCLTPNCAFGGTPAICANRAAPRTPIVQMGNGASLVFVPPNPKIELGDCVIWRSPSGTHSSSGTACPDGNLCNAVSPPVCEWDSANVASAGTATCYYDPAQFPAASADPFYCRFHATPTSGSMRGTLQVTTAIQLTVGKDSGTNSVKLSWTGGGVAGDISYKVARQSAGDPGFPAASTTTVNPDGGVFGTTFTDAGDLANATPRYYLVRNKQTNEP